MDFDWQVFGTVVGGYGAFLGATALLGKGVKNYVTPALRWTATLRPVRAAGRGIATTLKMLGGALATVGIVLALILFVVSIVSLLVMPLAAVPLWALILVILLLVR